MQIIKVWVKAGARNDRIKMVEGGYEISVRAKTAGGMANDAVLALFSRRLVISKKKLRIVKGLRSPSKTIEIL